MINSALYTIVYLGKPYFFSNEAFRFGQNSGIGVIATDCIICTIGCGCVIPSSSDITIYVCESLIISPLSSSPI